MHLVHEELERQKVECAQKEEILQKREDDLRDKDLKLQESLIGFSRFLQENAVKKKRAEKKSADEIKSRLEKEQEIIQLEEALLKLKLHRSATLANLDRLMMYQKYLESVVEKATQYHEINDLMIRHATLDASRQDLKEHLAMCTEHNDELRAEFQNYKKSTANEIMTLNNEVSMTKQFVEQKKLETSQLQLQIDQMLQMAAARTLARSQICMAAENLFFRIDQVSVISRPLQDNPIKNLDMVSDFVTDLNYIQKLYKGTYGRNPTPKGG
ncbi:hypothetical protein KC19_12G080900 [Ceratodon purpureus]|uniref:DUF4200 domain-containing protein n=1 Tax=Ceratodon purpureus TaxID=3225 RepID=A0A8T0G5G1_CERPU|nr:hypothetical protein KC19_12G080900 [Ceratodon purpureus]